MGASSGAHSLDDKAGTDEVRYVASTPPPGGPAMAPVDAHLMFVDGHTVKVRVSDPPPETFVLATSQFANRVLFLRRHSANGAIYVERDRRKQALPVDR